MSPELIEAILQGRQPVALTATRLTELDLPLDWTEQHKPHWADFGNVGTEPQ